MPIPVFDCHADTPVELWRTGQSLRKNTCHISLEHAEKLPHYAQFFAYCTYGGRQVYGYGSRDLYDLPRRYMDDQLAQAHDAVSFCTTADQVEQAWQRNQAAALYSIEGAEAIACDAGLLERARADGVRMIALTWNADNRLAGCHMGAQTGLSAAGREFVRRAQELGILVDVSHCSDQTFADLMDVTTGPVVASHSNARAVCRHSRNLTDEMYLRLCQTGGLAGINLYAEFLSDGNADFSSVYAHIDHFLQISGSDRHIGLGGDLDGCDALPEGFAHVSDYHALAEFLLGKYPQDTVERLFFRNVLAVMRRCEK